MNDAGAALAVGLGRSACDINGNPSRDFTRCTTVL